MGESRTKNGAWQILTPIAVACDMIPLKQKKAVQSFSQIGQPPVSALHWQMRFVSIQSICSSQNLLIRILQRSLSRTPEDRLRSSIRLIRILRDISR